MANSAHGITGSFRLTYCLCGPKGFDPWPASGCGQARLKMMAKCGSGPLQDKGKIDYLQACGCECHLSEAALKRGTGEGC